MADAEDLKSSGDFSSCGFDSHPGHQSFLLKMNELLCRSFPCTSGVLHFAKELTHQGFRRWLNLPLVVPVESGAMVRSVSP